MKRFVDGIETDLSADARVDVLSDRLMVHTSDGSYSAVAVRDGDAILVSYRGGQFKVEKSIPRSGREAGAESGELRAPMPGQIVDLRSSAGDNVRKGQVILVLEAMKTQQPFAAPYDGTLKRLDVALGDQVADGQLLALVERSHDAEDH